MSSVIVTLLFIFSIFMLFFLLCIIMFTIALLIFSPRDKAARSYGTDEKKSEEGGV